MSMTPRDEMVEIQKEIDVLNSRKASWQRAYEVEREKDPDYPMPAELRAFNKQLGPLYAKKDVLLEEHPELATEFGGKKKRKEKDPTGFAARTTAMQLGDQQRAARNRKKADVPSDFWEFCRTAQPQIRQNMDSWEDAVVRSRYEQWRAENAEKAKRDEEERKAKAESAKQDAAKKEEERKAKESAEMFEKYQKIPSDFRQFLEYLKISPPGGGEWYPDLLVKRWEEKDMAELYQLWLEEKQESSAA